MLKHTTSPLTEAELYYEMGVDGLFVEFPHLTKQEYDLLSVTKPFQAQNFMTLKRAHDVKEITQS